MGCADTSRPLPDTNCHRAEMIEEDEGPTSGAAIGSARPQFKSVAEVTGAWPMTSSSASQAVGSPRMGSLEGSQLMKATLV